MSTSEPYSCHAWAYHHKWYGLPKRGQLEVTAMGLRFTIEKDNSFLFAIPRGEELLTFYPLSTSFRVLHKEDSWNVSFAPPAPLYQNFQEHVREARRGTAGQLIAATSAYLAFKKAAEQSGLHLVSHAEWKMERVRRRSAGQPVHH